MLRIDDNVMVLYHIKTHWTPQCAELLHIELLLGFPAGSGLLLTVNIEADGLLRVNTKSFFNHLSYPKYRVRLRSVSKPHCELVTLATNVYNSPVHLNDVEDKHGAIGAKLCSCYLVSMLVSVFANEEEQDLQPVLVQVVGPLPLVHVDHPPAAGRVPLVLPVGEDPLLEERIV